MSRTYGKALIACPDAGHVPLTAKHVRSAPLLHVCIGCMGSMAPVHAVSESLKHLNAASCGLSF